MDAKRSMSAGFVGRDAEMARLSAALDEATAGQGRPVLLEGEPGIGKTRLLEEFASAARVARWVRRPYSQPDSASSSAARTATAAVLGSAASRMAPISATPWAPCWRTLAPRSMVMPPMANTGN